MSKQLQILTACPFSLVFNINKRVSELPVKGITQNHISKLIAADFIQTYKNAGDLNGLYEVRYELTSAGKIYMEKLK
jgi:hypothetical protein